MLLDTNALIWIDRNHARTRALARRPGRLHVSPATLLELQFLVEAGRLELRKGTTVRDLANDDRWFVDEPPSGTWFARATELGWTRDPFDRLIVAHAQLRGWPLATGDTALIARLGASAVLAI
ncbi:MAG: type II toxin-antitoxin system VapC family toxin [Vicinamibacterales bacterium]